MVDLVIVLWVGKVGYSCIFVVCIEVLLDFVEGVVFLVFEFLRVWEVIEEILFNIDFVREGVILFEEFFVIIEF